MQIVSRITLTAFISLLLANCSSTKTMQKIMSSWVGSDINKVIDRWGFPNEEKIINGRKIYVWYYTKQATLPQTSQTTGSISSTGSFYANTVSSPSATIHGNCTRILEVDNKNVVKSWQWRGNNCPFAEWMEYSKWRKDIVDK